MATRSLLTLLSRARRNVCHLKSIPVRRTLITLTLANTYVIKFEEEDKDEVKHPEKIQIPEPYEFSNTYQLQQAFNRAVDSSVTAVSISYRSYTTALIQYTALLQSAITTLKTGLEVSIALCEHLNIEEKLSNFQSELYVSKSLLSDGLYVFEESAKMLNQTAGISYLVGNEASSGFATAHVQNMQQEVERMKNEAKVLEREYLELQKQFIEKISKEDQGTTLMPDNM